MMRATKGLVAAVFAAVLTGGSAMAAPATEPAELPPASFTGNQYVDSKGCVFLRAGLGDTTTWVARLGRDRTPVCGYDPTLKGDAAAAAAAAPAPAEEPAQVAEPAKAAPEPAAKTAAVAAAKPANPAPKKRKTAAKPAAPASTALVATKAVDSDATYCTGRTGAAQRYVLSDGRRVTRCARAKDEAVTYLNGLGAPGLVVSSRAPTESEARRALAAESGTYRVTWSRGKLAKGVEAAPAAAAGVQGAYVQIGAFAEPANADRALQTVEGLGLPASSSSSGSLRVILAGPFASQADLSNALALLRRNGYRDAFPTRG